jgi:hypothetical protein
MSFGSESVSVLPAQSTQARRAVPWQMWVVVGMLALEGIGNLFAIAVMPIAAFWLLMKCLFIVGLIRRWRWVFVLFLIVTALHVLAIEMLGPVTALLNVVLITLVGSTWRWFFCREKLNRYGNET